MLLMLLPTLLLGAPSEPVPTWYVSPAGRDTWSGRRDTPNASQTDGPFATLERARDAIRASRQAGAPPAGPVVVEVLGGRYERRQTFTLGAEDSGTAEAPVIYRARAGEQVILSGGQRLDGWQPVTDPVILARLEAAAREQVRQVDLQALGVTSYGCLLYTSRCV